jgi:hypothetical protein
MDRMKPILVRIAAAVLAAVCILQAADLRAIETGYGEDPVPDTHRSLRPPYTAYGMDPIPVKSLLERWQEFRYYRPARARAARGANADSVPRWKWLLKAR